MQADEIRAIYADYLEKAREAERRRRPGDGLFGFGRKPADDPCHADFLKALREAVEALAQTGSDGEMAETLRLICDAPSACAQEPPGIYWTLVAAHGAMPAGIPSLDRREARELYEHYAAAWPKVRRMPVQRQVLKALREAAERGAGDEKTGGTNRKA